MMSTRGKARVLPGFLRGFAKRIWLALVGDILANQRNIMANQEDILALQYLAPLSQSYLPWSRSAMRPSGLVAVLNEIVVNDRSCIVECGGGISTFYIGRVIRERNGHLFTIEHREDWADILVRRLTDENLQDWVSVVYAPLAPTDLALNGDDWYDTQKIGNALSGIEIDLLIVDGPPAYRDEVKYARYPAVPYFMRFMCDDYTVILDDIGREGEQEIVRRWEECLGISFDRRFTNGGIAIGRSNPSFTI